ncbi:unnamed protein product [Trifolium pratense]|uniref:Uncharacterized protein n=1 Tax=Trifolium pratense TaxID=57577 RepID=A0ACB0KXD6_TRIPR|nr:unnamed protein product [Trifolium pratense]
MVLVFLRGEEESLGARARGELGIRDLRRVFFESRFYRILWYFDVESSVKLRSDCDTGKGFILYIKSIV